MSKKYGVWAYGKDGILVQRGEAEVMGDGKTIEVSLFSYPKARAYLAPLDEEIEDEECCCASETPQFSDAEVTKPLFVFPH